MKNLNINSLTKSFKSMKIVKMINNGLVKFAKIVKIQPRLLYIILGLLVVVLVALGLGTRREGFDSMSNANNALIQIVNNMNGGINYIFDWANEADKTTFKNNINYWYDKKMIYLVNQRGKDLQTYDLNNNKQIYQLNPALQGTKDALGTEMLMFVDDTKPPEPTPEFLQKYTLIDIKSSITTQQLDVLTKQITDKINSFSTVDPTGQIRLQSAFDALLQYANNLAAYLVSHPRETTGIPSFTDILSQGSLTRKTDEEQKEYDFKEEKEKEEKEYNEYEAKYKAYEAKYKAEKALKDKADQDKTDKTKADQDKTDKIKADKDKADKADKEYREYKEYKERQQARAGLSTSGAGTSTAGTSTSTSTASPSGATIASSSYQWGNAGADSVGLLQSNIQAGSQDMYMLKTQVVPPSNPAGATYGASGAAGTTAGSGSASAANVNPSPCLTGNCNTAPVPPCPPCERCPEPAFDCKKVPNYNSASMNQYLPQPVLADFSQFGM